MMNINTSTTTSGNGDGNDNSVPRNDSKSASSQKTVGARGPFQSPLPGKDFTSDNQNISSKVSSSVRNIRNIARSVVKPIAVSRQRIFTPTKRSVIPTYSSGNIVQQPPSEKLIKNLDVANTTACNSRSRRRSAPANKTKGEIVESTWKRRSESDSLFAERYKRYE